MKDKIRYLSVQIFICKQSGRGPMLKAVQTSPAQRVFESDGETWCPHTEKKGAASPTSLVLKHLNKCICFFCFFPQNIISN